MDHLKEGIGLRGYGQKDPLIEYKKESFKIYQTMLANFDEEVIKLLFHLRVAEKVPPSGTGADEVRQPTAESGSTNGATQRQPQAISGSDRAIDKMTKDIRLQGEKRLAQAQFAGSSEGSVAVKQVINKGQKVGRNQLCPCGSGKKYKRCHGQIA